MFRFPARILNLKAFLEVTVEVLPTINELERDLAGFLETAPAPSDLLQHVPVQASLVIFPVAFDSDIRRALNDALYRAVSHRSRSRMTLGCFRVARSTKGEVNTPRRRDPERRD